MDQQNTTTRASSRQNWFRALDILSGVILGFSLATILLGDIQPLVQGFLRGEIQQTWMRLAAFLGIMIATVGIAIWQQWTELLLKLIAGGFVLGAIGTCSVLSVTSQISDESRTTGIVQIISLLVIAVVIFLVARAIRGARAVRRELAVSKSPYKLPIDSNAPHFGKLGNSHVAITLWMLVIDFLLGLFIIQMDHYYQVTELQVGSDPPANRLLYTLFLAFLMLLVLLIGSIGEFLVACFIGALNYWEYFFPSNNGATFPSVEVAKPLYLVLLALLVIGFIVLNAVRLKGVFVSEEFPAQNKRVPILGLSIWKIVHAIRSTHLAKNAKSDQDIQTVENSSDSAQLNMTFIPWNPWHWLVFTFEYLFKEELLLRRAYNLSLTAIRRFGWTALISTFLLISILIALIFVQNNAILIIASVITDANALGVAVLLWYGCWQFNFFLFMLYFIGIVLALVVWEGGWAERILVFAFSEFVASAKFTLVADQTVSNLIAGGLLLLLPLLTAWSKLRSLQYHVRTLSR
ncbi:MAG TPA: hypothetical protein VJ183_04755 [Chloroflexia bacterium]|nr:hypothetical protein [Chloroflexia bacterium]